MNAYVCVCVCVLECVRLLFGVCSKCVLRNVHPFTRNWNKEGVEKGVYSYDKLSAVGF